MKGKAIVEVEIEYEAKDEKAFESMVERIQQNFAFGIGTASWRYEQKRTKSVRKA